MEHSVRFSVHRGSLRVHAFASTDSPRVCELRQLVFPHLTQTQQAGPHCSSLHMH